MTTALNTTTETDIKYLATSFAITTTLSDYEQIVIVVPTLEHQLVNGRWTRVNTGNQDFRLEKLHYSLENNVVSLSSIEGRGFTKAGTLRVRDLYYYAKDLLAFPEILTQIPDHFHDQAKEKFVEGAKELLQNATAISANGLSTSPLEKN
jgi:hypothetical protein